MPSADTIFALSSGAPPAAIAIMRISGPSAFDILQDLTRSYGQTIIAVTHDNDFARKSDRIIEMMDGEIIS